MNEQRPPRHYDPETEQSSTPPEIDAILDELADIIRQEPYPGHPDWQARKSSVTHTLDESFLDDEDRRTRISALLKTADEQYRSATEDLTARPNDVLAKIRHDVARDRLYKATVAAETERLLAQTSETVAERHDAKHLHTANDAILAEINQFWSKDTLRHPSPEQKKQQILFLLKSDLQSVAIQFMYIETLKEEVKWEYHLEPKNWSTIHQQYKDKKRTVEKNADDIIWQLNIPELKSLKTAMDVSAQLETKPVELLESVFRAIGRLQDELNDIRRFLRGMMKKQM